MDDLNEILTADRGMPLVINDPITLVPMVNQTFKLESRIVGARPHEFIIIESAKIFISRWFSSSLEGELLCTYPHRGGVCSFKSKVLNTFEGELTFIEYPEVYEIDNHRKYERFPVSFEGQVSFFDYREPLTAVIRDLSREGCRVCVDSLPALEKDMACSIGFTLANGRVIDGIDGRISYIRSYRLTNKTVFGVELTSPLTKLQFPPRLYHLDDLNGSKAKDAQIAQARETIQVLADKVARLERPWWEKVLRGQA